ncbi:MAG: phytoene/squalene synthase family protein [Phycisphaerales bacterium]
MAESPSQFDHISTLIDGVEADLTTSTMFCRQITAQAGSSFAVGIRLTPARCRDAMHAVYAWMRLADDIADAQAPAGQRAAMLDRFEARTEAAFSGEPGGAIWPAFARAAAEHQFKMAWFESFLQGVRTDLHTVKFETDEQLEAYCDRVAGNVGRCCVAIWGMRRQAEFDRACDLAGLRGRALQRINIARDLEEDARADRRYVPTERLSRLGAGPMDARVRDDLVREAMDMLDESGPLEGMIRKDAGPALWAMTRAYRLVARRLGQAGASPSLGGRAKLGIAAGALGRRVLAAGRLA